MDSRTSYCRAAGFVVLVLMWGGLGSALAQGSAAPPAAAPGGGALAGVVLAGGGLRRGIVHGETDGTGENVTARPVSVPDLFATVTQALGLDPDESIATPSGRPITHTDHGKPIAELLR